MAEVMTLEVRRGFVLVILTGRRLRQGIEDGWTFLERTG